MKRILSAALACLLIGLTPLNISAMDTTLSTSHRDDTGLHFALDGTTLRISGSIECPRLEKVWLQVGTTEVILPLTSEVAFTQTFDLPSEPTFSLTPVTIATKQAGEDTYWSYIWQTVFVEATADGYTISTAPALPWNRTVLETWVNPADFLVDITDQTVVDRAFAITAGLTTDAQKVLAIHRWVADNIYYDHDHYTGKTATTPTSPTEVLSAGYATSAGYANLVQALCQAVGIPCRTLASFAAGADTDGFISAEDMPGLTKANHTHAAAWVEGRWVHMDTAWDSPHRYENGVKTRGVTSGQLYFDVTLPFLSLNHRLLEYDGATTENTPSTWAIPEVSDAFSHGLVPYTLQKQYTSPISRADFCTLLMTMLQQRTGVNSLAALAEHLQADTSTVSFTDIEGLSAKEAILTAAALGVVNGRGNGIFDPSAGITRQEAAVMLMRAARVLEIPMGTPRTFGDMQEAAEWAVTGILFVSSLVTPADGDTAGRAVMGGVSETKFQPLGQYTVEQAILTMVRLFAVPQ